MTNKTAPQIRAMRQSEQKIAMVTAYDYPTGVLASRAGADIILVGDSLGMVILGYEDTLKVTMADMIHHCKAVARGADGPLTVGDMPFMSYQISTEQAVQNAGRFIQEGGMDAVKLEGAGFTDRVHAIAKSGIPVMGHLGLTPQSVKAFGGFKVQGKTLNAARKLLEDALKLEDAGVFSIVLEGIPAELAEMVTGALHVPTIGIGAGAACTGQVLVFHDLLAIPGIAPFQFVRTFAEAGSVMEEGLQEFVSAVRNGNFPEHCHSTHLSEPVKQALQKEVVRKCM
ncbi:MAG: 3-methyl-2-oxobutanoate hydroxymethyltransferase [Acidobacteria bacterium]|nr:3-methyl-2-oxobutanoate hydroxymethyltransferase [Acidobacteriota bacterium]